MFNILIPNQGNKNLRFLCIEPSTNFTGHPYDKITIRKFMETCKTIMPSQAIIIGLPVFRDNAKASLVFYHVDLVLTSSY